MKTISSYEHYKVADFLNDDYFIESELHPTDTSACFWEEVILNYPNLKDEIDNARLFLKSILSDNKKNILSDEEKNELWEQIETKNSIYNIKRRNRRITRSIIYSGIAACLIILATTQTNKYIHRYDFKKSTIMMVQKPNAHTSNDVQLFLSKNTKMNIAGKNAQLQYNNQGQVVISNQNNTQNVVASNEYNQLIVPYGKRSSIIFSDGTKVIVNANSRIVYPTKFASDKREIYVEGEAYLEVKHNDKLPFIVRTNKVNVEVLGTKFNVCAPLSSSTAQVVLAQGRVKVNTSSRQTYILRPGQMLSYADNNNTGEIENVDVSQYISWIDGYYKFNRRSIQNIMNILSNYYGKRIIVDKDISDITFSGKLDLRDDIDTVLDMIAQTVPAKVSIYKDMYIIRN